MVLALYVLAGVMAAGGLIAIYSGSDIIVMERGWTMVIAGSVFTACGAVLAGIATAVARLQTLHGDFGRLSERLGRPQAPSFAPSLDTPPQAPPTGERTNPPPLFAGPEIKEHRDLDIVPEPVLSAPSAPEPAAGPLPAKERSEKREAPAVVPDLDASLFEREPAPKTPPAEAAKTEAAEAPPAKPKRPSRARKTAAAEPVEAPPSSPLPLGEGQGEGLQALPEGERAGRHTGPRRPPGPERGATASRW